MATIRLKCNHNERRDNAVSTQGDWGWMTQEPSDSHGVTRTFRYSSAHWEAVPETRWIPLPIETPVGHERMLHWDEQAWVLPEGYRFVVNAPTRRFIIEHLRDAPSTPVGTARIQRKSNPGAVHDVWPTQFDIWIDDRRFVCWRDRDLALARHYSTVEWEYATPRHRWEVVRAITWSERRLTILETQYTLHVSDGYRLTEVAGGYQILKEVAV
jgi:hypothetical protein